MRAVSLSRLLALCRKESLQIIRDPSSNVIAFILPVLLLFIFSFGINLDSIRLKVGLVLEDSSLEARHFADSLCASPYLEVETSFNRAEMQQAMNLGQVRGYVVVPQEFSKKLAIAGDSAPILSIADGSEPNTAAFVHNYVSGAWRQWRLQRAAERGEAPPPGIELEARFWFNPSTESRNFLIPGSITIIMTVIGTLLTSLVVAREWERGTMEALLATSVTRAELLLSKLLPYYLLGMISLMLCVAVAVWVLKVPFRGSLLALWGIGSLFLASSLGIGLLFSTLLRNQFNAAQVALNAAFMPALMLSGFVYEIRSMPVPVQAVTYLIPARYFVTAIQSIFQAGDIAPLLLGSAAFLGASSLLFIGLTAWKTARRLS